MYPGYLSVWVLAAITVDTYTTLNNIRSKVACTYELIRLIETRSLYMQPVGRDASEGAVVEDNDRIRVICETFEGEKGIIRLYDDVSLLRIGEDGVRLYELLGELVVESLE